ncbi:MAG: MBL fold metallo-hydrolase [Lachnospiraceae bacterium]|nr:MBL fold metallo-hydrolase [Lachnospiraceae bacterium]
MKTVSELKSKRIGDGGRPHDYALVMAYLNQIEKDPNRKIYEIDPYVAVYQLRDNIYGLFTHNCDYAGDIWMYLILGPEKAMLIDTAFGLGDTKALVDYLADGREVIVVNTHPHPDHAYGNCRFDKVYCHKFAVPMLERQDEHLWDYLFDENGNNIWLEFDREDLPVYKPYEIVPMEDGSVFQLGDGYEVEMKWVPGHASSHCMFLDKQAKILFAGDGVCAHVSGEGTGKRPHDDYYMYNNLECYRRELRKLADRLDEFDSIFPAHFNGDLPADALIPAVLEACDAILDEGKFDLIEDFKTGDGSIVKRQYKYIRGFSLLGVVQQNQGVYIPDEFRE